MKENQKLMASNASGSHKLKKNTLPKFEADIYANIPSGDLVVFSVHYLIEHKIKINLEDIVSICFQLFPHKFGLKRFPKWPDSALVSRRWSDVRRKRYIAAKADLEYYVTSKGLSLIKKAEKILGIEAPKPAIKVQPSQPKKEAVISVEKTQTEIIKEKAINPVKSAGKIKALTIKPPTVIQKKIAKLFKEEKETPPAPVHKTHPIRARKVSPASAPAKQTQAPETKLILVKQAKKAQPVQKEQATLLAPVKKLSLIRAKKTSSALAKQTQTVQPALTQVKKDQPIREEKAAPITSVKKMRPIRAKKTSAAPVKQVQALQPVAMPVKKPRPIQEEKAAVPVPVKKTQPIRAKKVSPVPAKQAHEPEVKAHPAQKDKASPPAQVKKVRTIRTKKASPAPVKQAQPPEIKVSPEAQAKKKQAIPVSTPVEKTQPIYPLKAPTKIVKPKPVKKTKSVEPVIIRQGKVEKTQFQKADSIPPINVTREEKERAGKFTRMMEKSDAYIHYKKNGSNSKINEFDFRSLLLCTMESSPETLARNVKLFKNYAGIHNRQDLTTFLVFCEEKFSYLLKPQNKSMRKAKK
jgi:hypothetical protein